jgi:hypothetical protein
MSIPKSVQELLDKKAEQDNTIDLNAYGNGLLDMYEALHQASATSGNITREALLKAFCAGSEFEIGEQESWASYNKFTGKQNPNNELNFDQWYDKNYRLMIKIMI